MKKFILAFLVLLLVPIPEANSFFPEVHVHGRHGSVSVGPGGVGFNNGHIVGVPVRRGHSPKVMVRPRSVWCDERGRCLEVRPKYRNVVPSYRNDRLYRVQ